MRLFHRLFGRTLGQKRSGKWRAFRKKHIKKECEACGATQGLVLHHIIPVYIDHSKELRINNVFTLCGWRANNCHWRFGHLFQSWKSYNKRVREVSRIIKQERNETI